MRKACLSFPQLHPSPFNSCWMKCFFVVLILLSFFNIFFIMLPLITALGRVQETYFQYNHKTVQNGLTYVISKKLQVKRITLHSSQEYLTLISTSHNQLWDRHLFIQIEKSNPHYSSPTLVKREKILMFNNQISWHF